VIRRDLLTLTRGGREQLTAPDHFQLGQFALSMRRSDLAAHEFQAATAKDRALAPRVREAFAAFRKSTEAAGQAGRSAALMDKSDADPPAVFADGSAGGATDIATEEFAALGVENPRVMEVYKTFGAKVQEVLGKGIVLIETDHFLIWTDWEPLFRPRLEQWCEAMFAELRRQFNLPKADPVFLAKCPIFCFRSRASFAKFARHFDGYDAANAVGYTRSIEKNGHVHVALLRIGHADADFDALACTLVHEGTHAFLHRLADHRLIPHWVNEGFAEWMADRVLGAESCHRGAKADMLARFFVRHDRPLDGFLENEGPIAVEQYPLAHSFVAQLIRIDLAKFSTFVRQLKSGQPLSVALANSFDGLTLAQLENRWREAVIIPIETAGGSARN
jgi:hypothetical protein